MRWLRDQAIGPAFIAPDSSWQNGFVASFNDKLRDKLLNREWFRTRAEAKVLSSAGGRSATSNDRTVPHRYQLPAEARRNRLETATIEPRLTA